MTRSRLSLSLVVSAILLLVAGCADESIPAKPVEIRSEHQLDSVMLTLNENPDDIKTLSGIWRYLTMTGQYERLIRHAERIFKEAEDEELKLYSGTYLAQAYLPLSSFDSVKYYLDYVYDKAEKSHNTDLLPITYNTKAVLALQTSMDYALALDCLKSALEVVEAKGDETNTGLLLCNIANIYSMRNDTAGIRYARQAYELGQSSGNEYIRPSSTILMASLLGTAGKYEEALPYANELLELSEQPNGLRHKAMANLLLGNIFMDLGNPDKAGGHYAEAMKFSPYAVDEIVMKTYSRYGTYLLSQNQYEKAKEIFYTGLHVSDSTGSLESKETFLLGLSEALQALGKTEEAFNYYRRYHTFADSIKSNQKEREFNQLLMKYERLNHSSELKEKELNLLKARKRTQITVIVLLAMTAVAVSVINLYRRKNKMYGQLVEKHQKLIVLEQSLREKDRDARQDQGNGDEDSSERKLFEEIEKLMNDRKIYRLNDISLDKLADMLQSNRYYVSRAINTFGKTSFYSYINTYRMREAVAVLSDPDDNTPLKALCSELGYNSVSAFYRSFQKETGVPPSRYREEIKKKAETHSEAL